MTRKTLYAFIISFVLLITVIVLNRITFTQMKSFTGAVDHTRDVITTFESMSKNFKSAQIYTTTYKGDSLKNFYTLYKRDADNIAPELRHLRTLVRDNSQQSRRLDTLERMINKHMPLLMQKNITEIISMGEGWRLNELFIIHEMINRGIDREKQLLNQRKQDLEKSTHLNNLLSIAFGVVAFSLFVFTFLNNFFISKKRKWLEGFLESILNTSQNGVAHCKAIREHGQIVDYRIEFLNDAVYPLFGMSLTTLIGKRLSEAHLISGRNELQERFGQVIETGVSTEFELPYKRGSADRWLLVSVTKLDDGVTASFLDISQLKKFEEELKNKIIDLEHSNSELEQYAYAASHDLQEPLRKIRSFGSYLQDTQASKLDERGQQLLGKIMNSAERMSSLIKDILSFSSMKKHTDFVPVDLNETLKGVLQDLDLLITQKKATVHFDPLPTIEALPLQMTQLFYNLINNSLKFAKENVPPVINISCKKLKGSPEGAADELAIPYYELRFTDNGIGFNIEFSEQIFGLFKRLNHKHVYSGSGIGLALCRKVVENHHGQIFAEGKEQTGATFRVRLPEKQI